MYANFWFFFLLSACNLSVISITFKVHFEIFLIRQILFLHNYVLIILCVIYMFELKVQILFVPEIFYIIYCTKLLFNNKRKNVYTMLFTFYIV